MGGTNLISTYVEIDGKRVELRPMTEDYILAGDMTLKNHLGELGVCTADCALPRRPALGNRYFSVFHQAVLSQYRGSAILAWHGNDVVGFINFHPAELMTAAGWDFTDLCLYRDAVSFARRIERDGLPKITPRTLMIRCTSVSPEFQRKGLGKALAQAAIDWARDNGYRAVQVRAPADGWWIPGREFWEGLGFTCISSDDNWHLLQKTPL